MDKKLKKVYLILTFSAAVLMLLSFLVERFMPRTINGDPNRFLLQNAFIPFALSELALVCSLIYCLMDGKKKASLFYKGYAGAYLIMDIYLFHMAIISGPNVLENKQALFHLFIMILLVEYSAVLLLAFAINQGKKRAGLLAMVGALADVFLMFCFIVEGFTISFLLSSIAKILMIYLLCFLTEAKYLDKESRQTI